MPLPAVEHQRVKREVMAARNAYAWVRRRGGSVRAWDYYGQQLYLVKVPGFHPRCAIRLEWAVDAIKEQVEHWTGEKGPTGARLRERLSWPPQR